MVLITLIISLNREIQFKFEKDFIQIPFVAVSLKLNKIKEYK